MLSRYSVPMQVFGICSLEKKEIKIAVLIMQRRKALKYSEHFVHPEILCSLNPSAQSFLPAPCLISRRLCAYGSNCNILERGLEKLLPLKLFDCCSSCSKPLPCRALPARAAPGVLAQVEIVFSNSEKNLQALTY